tara:strand:- start:273 stop:875 length:603 start_codon:yes stop_codon:yes gene_type:complete
MIEIIGIAGSGKTTTLKELKKINPKLITHLDVSLKDLSFKILFRHLSTLTLILYYRRSTKLFKQYIALKVIIKKTTEFNKNNVCFDHGPIFILTKLLFEIPELKKTFYKDLKECLLFFDRIVYLDASSDELIKRINNRTQSHRMKFSNKKKIRTFLEGYRKTFLEVASFMSNSGINVEFINTEKKTIAEVVNSVQKIYKS